MHPNPWIWVVILVWRGFPPVHKVIGPFPDLKAAEDWTLKPPEGCDLWIVAPISAPADWLPRDAPSPL